MTNCHTLIMEAADGKMRSTDVANTEHLLRLIQSIPSPKTDIMTKEWSGKTTREYRDFKGLKKDNPWDNITNMELVLNMLAEVSVTDLSRETDPIGMDETAIVA